MCVLFFFIYIQLPLSSLLIPISSPGQVSNKQNDIDWSGLIISNPMMAGWVMNPENWKPNRAKDFCSSESRLEQWVKGIEVYPAYKGRVDF